MSLLLATIGMLCLDARCVAAERMPARVAPAAQERTFVWIDADRKTAMAGTIAPNASRLTAGAETHAIVVRLSDAPVAETPVTLELISPERKWSFTIPTRSRLALALTHPACECTLQASANEYRNASSPLGDQTSILLRRLPAIRGLVLDGTTGAPLAAAEVTHPGASKSAITNANGVFRLVVEQEWPTALRVHHPTRAPKLVAVPKTIADTELPAIALTAGGTLQLTIAPPIGGSEPLSWEVRKDDRLARAGEIATGTSTAQIVSLDPGHYRLLIQGREPLQRYATHARILENQVTELAIDIRPIVVEGTVTFDGSPLPSPTITARPRDGAWQAKFTADDDGRFAEEVWQGGTYTLSVSKEPLVRIWGTDRELEGNERVNIALAVPNRRIRGRATEARTGAAIADAVVFAEMKLGSRASVRNKTRTGADGTYEFAGVEAGAITIEAMKDGYRFGRPIRFELPESASIHEQPLGLEELAIKRTITVTDARGIPVADAAVFAPHHVAATDANGRAIVSLASPDERPNAFVIPRSGSLGFARLSESGDTAIRILDNAALEVRMQSTAGEPIRRAAVRMRIDGTIIPADVISWMAHIQGIPLYSDAAGTITFPRLPPGQYDLMPLIRSGPKPIGPVTVAVLPGPQTVVMKFAER